MNEEIRSNSQLQVLKESELLGRQFKVYGSIEEPLFLAKDVAEMIQHTNPSKMVEMIDLDEWLVRRSNDSLGRQQKLVFLTEGGLYEVLMQSRKPIAKEFKKGVKAILKSIRRTGGYGHFDTSAGSVSGQLPYLPEVEGVKPVLYEGGLWYCYSEAVKNMGGSRKSAGNRKKKYPQHFKMIYGRNFITKEYLHLLSDYYRYRQTEMKFVESATVEATEVFEIEKGEEL